MKLNENFLIHQSDNGEILIPVGDETHLLENNDLSLEDVLNHFYQECPNDDKEVIKKGVSEFINKLVEINAIIL